VALRTTLKIGAAVAVLTLLLASVSLLVLEGWHHARYGHFVGYGLHTDVVLGDSDVGKGDMYYARAWNLSASTAEIEGCRLPGGIAGSGIMYHWDVQRFDVVRQQWNSLRGANNWVPEPFGGYGNDAEWKCKPEITRIRPLSTRTLGWVYREWVTRGDAVRMAIHTSIELPPDGQRIIYTPIFSVEP
jgi:hypothetical protein